MHKIPELRILIFKYLNEISWSQLCVCIDNQWLIFLPFSSHIILQKKQNISHAYVGDWDKLSIYSLKCDTLMIDIYYYYFRPQFFYNMPLPLWLMQKLHCATPGNYTYQSWENCSFIVNTGFIVAVICHIRSLYINWKNESAQYEAKGVKSVTYQPASQPETHKTPQPVKPKGQTRTPETSNPSLFFPPTARAGPSKKGKKIEWVGL